MSFEPVPYDACPTCGRGTNMYYEARKVNMAAAFRSGVPVRTIASAYGMSQEWAMKLIEEQLGREAVLEVHEMYRVEV